jgi:hypothetical protein
MGVGTGYMPLFGRKMRAAFHAQNGAGAGSKNAYSFDKRPYLRFYAFSISEKTPSQMVVSSVFLQASVTSWREEPHLSNTNTGRYLL